MLKLIKIELYKQLHKKNIYIILLLMTIFCFLNNYLYWKDYNNEGFYKYEDKTNIKKEIKNTIKELKKYDYHKEDELTTYIKLKTKYDILLLKSKYNKNTWQYRKINDYMYDIIYNNNYNIYKNIHNNKIKEEYKEALNNIEINNWQYFLNKKKEEYNKELEELTNSKIEDKLIQKDINNKINTIKLEIDIINYRLNNNIDESKTYLDLSINKYKEYHKKLYITKEINSTDKINYYKAISEYNINKYIMDNKKNINKENTINFQLRDILKDYELFFVIFIIIISSSIMSEEFTRGTIKLLLIKPYSRCKILIGKYLSIITLLLLSIIFIITTEIAIGNIFFNLEDLKTEIVIYNHNINRIVTYSLFKYMLLNITYRLPFYILLLTITYSISIITNSNIIPFIISILLYMTSNIINNLAISYNIRWMKYLLTTNWNIYDYAYGNIKEFPYTNLKLSIIVISIYYLLLTTITIINFNKKNIRNV